MDVQCAYICILYMCLFIYVCVCMHIHTCMGGEKSAIPNICMYVSVCTCICVHTFKTIGLKGIILPLKTSPEAPGKPWNYVIDKTALH